MIMSGRLVTVDGGEGAGKTTQMESIREYLERRGYRVVMTREPGGTSLARKFARCCLDIAMAA